MRLIGLQDPDVKFLMKQLNAAAVFKPETGLYRLSVNVTTDTLFYTLGQIAIVAGRDGQISVSQIDTLMKLISIEVMDGLAKSSFKVPPLAEAPVLPERSGCRSFLRFFKKPTPTFEPSRP